jgi:hypothetical protein
MSIDSQIDNLTKKINDHPSDSRRPDWLKTLKGLEARNQEILEKARSQDISKLVKNSNSTNSRPRHDSMDLTAVIEDFSATILDPDVGAVRIPDSLTENTALYHSVVQIPIKVDPTVNNGAFSGMVTPVLGSDISTRNFMIAIPNGASTNYAASSSFVQNVNGADIRVDPEAAVLLNPSLSQNTFAGTTNVPTLGGSVQWNSVGLSGVNNSGFSFSPAGVPSPAGFTPTVSAYFIPSGAWFNSIQVMYTPGVNAFGPNVPSSAITGVNGFNMALHDYNFVTGVDTIISDWHVDTPLGGTPGYAGPEGNYFRFVYGATVAPPGGPNLQGPLLSVTFYSEWSPPPNHIYYCAFNAYKNPSAGGITPLYLKWDITTSPVSSLAFSSSAAILQKYRPVSQKVHFKCTLSDFNNSGQIAMNLLQGGAQDTYFSTIGGNFLNFDMLSNNNLPMRTYAGKLSEGAYGFWVPDTVLDVQLRTYAESLNYDLPFFAYAGNWTPTGASPGSVTIGYLRVVTNYEFTTVSRLFVTEPQEGSDLLMQAVQSSVAKLPKVMENPRHDRVLKSMVSVMGKGIRDVLSIGKTVGNIGSKVGSLLDAVGKL